jgi:hypothetical protein
MKNSKLFLEIVGVIIAFLVVVEMLWDHLSFKESINKMAEQNRLSQKSIEKMTEQNKLSEQSLARIDSTIKLMHEANQLVKENNDLTKENIKV